MINKWRVGFLLNIFFVKETHLFGFELSSKFEYFQRVKVLKIKFHVVSFLVSALGSAVLRPSSRQQTDIYLFTNNLSSSAAGSAVTSFSQFGQIDNNNNNNKNVSQKKISKKSHSSAKFNTKLRQFSQRRVYYKFRWWRWICSGVGAGAPFADVEELLDFEESALHARGVDLDPTELPVADGPVGGNNVKILQTNGRQSERHFPLKKEPKRSSNETWKKWNDQIDIIASSLSRCSPMLNTTSFSV